MASSQEKVSKYEKFYAGTKSYMGKPVTSTTTTPSGSQVHSPSVYTKEEQERIRQEKLKETLSKAKPDSAESVLQISQDWKRHPPTQEQQKKVFLSTGLKWDAQSKQWKQDSRPYSFGQPIQTPYGETKQKERVPTQTIDVGTSVSRTAVARLAQNERMSPDNIAISLSQTEGQREPTFKIQFYDTRKSYDEKRVKDIYEGIVDEEQNRAKELLRTERFIAYTKQKAGEGDIIANIAYHVAPRFTPADPLGLKTIGTTVYGTLTGKKLEEIANDVNKINEQALGYVSGRFGVEKGTTPKDFFSLKSLENMIGFTVESPVAQSGGMMLIGAGVGGIVKSVVTPSASVLSGTIALHSPKLASALSQAGTFAFAHAKTITRVLYASQAGLELLEAKKQIETGKELPDVFAGSGTRIIHSIAFGEGFGYGFEKGVPLKYETVTIGNKRIASTLQIEWKGKSYPLISKTPEGWKMGTPEFTEETIENIYGQAMRSYEGYIPKTPLETKIAQKNIVDKLDDIEQVLVGKSIKLRGDTFGTASQFIDDTLPIEEVFERHGISPKAQDAIRTWIDKQDDIIIYGSASQKAQSTGFAFRGIKDLDISIPNAEKKAQELFKIIEKTQGKGFATMKGTLISTKTGHFFDIHDDVVDIASGSGSFWNKKYIGYGFEQEPTIKIEGIKAQSLSEQASRKMASSLTLRTDTVAPSAHRIKDIVDYISAEKVLIASGSGLDVSSNTKLLADIQKSWIDKSTKLGVSGQKELFKRLEELRVDTPTPTILYSKVTKASNIKVVFDFDLDVPSPRSLSYPSPSKYAFDVNIKGLDYPSSSKSPSLDRMGIDYPSLGSKKSPLAKSPSMPSVSIGTPSPPSPNYPSIKSSSPSPYPSLSLPSPSPPSPPPPPSYNIPSPDTTKTPPLEFKLDSKIKKIKEPKLPRGIEKLGYAPDLGSIFVGRTVKAPRIKLAKTTFSGFEKRGIRI